ncbi:MAG: hypothetical protein KIT31_10250 [Deltaproteobacteria bacterium]|nr:hypothetical protein [Deltaproteobacteria bacterium]
MPRLLVIALVLGGLATARADRGPIRVAIQCEQAGRTKACPAFLAGLIDANKVLLNSPRAGADVVVYASAVNVALIDRLHLRFVGHAGGPAPVEVDVDLDTRETDDNQRKALEPAFLRGVALFVAARHPSAVTVALGVPSELSAAPVRGSPWGIELGVSGSGSYTQNYRSAGFGVHFVGRYLTRKFRAFTLQTLSGGLERLPPLTINGEKVSLDSENWKYRFGAEAVYSWCPSWSVGVGSYTFFEDPNGQFVYNQRTRAAVEWDAFAPDDPRGNRLAVFYHVGWMVERYNLRNVLGERFAAYPTHGVDAVGSVRHDKITYGISLASDVQVDHPTRRFLFTASPFATIQIGTRVDLSFSFSLTKRALPAPDPREVDMANFQQQSRLSFAEALALNGGISILIHFDPTNGARNNRIESI